jgi:trimethylamine--corrinoid protein Co-methyltransferase
MTARRRGRAARVEVVRAQRAAVNRLPAVKHGLEPMRAVSDDQLERIHQASLDILQDVGIEFRDTVALDQWRAAGAEVDGQRVRLDGTLLMGLIAKAPAEFDIVSRNPAHRFRIARDTMVFGTMQGPPYVRTLEGERRYSTLEDLDNFNKLTQMSPGLHIAGGFTCEPTDIDVPWRHLHINHSSLVHTDLPYFGLTTGRERAEDSIAMAEIAHGRDFMAENAVILGHVSGNSPLVWDSTMLEGLRAYVAARQVVLVSPFVLAAANTPADIAATVAQLNAEALAGLAYAQLVRPGAKVIYGQYSVSVSMRSGAPMSGMPEVSLITLLIGQLARRYGVPWRTTAAQASSKVFDAQSGYESATSMMGGAAAAANLMLHAGGWDEAGLVNCFAKFVADAEQNLLVARFVQGVSFERFDAALEAVRRIGPGGHYLGDPFTLEYFQDAFINPELLDYLNYEQWTALGAKDMTVRAWEKARAMLEAYEAPTLDPATREALDDFVARRRREIDPTIR